MGHMPAEGEALGRLRWLPCVPWGTGLRGLGQVNERRNPGWPEARRGPRQVPHPVSPPALAPRCERWRPSERGADSPPPKPPARWSPPAGMARQTPEGRPPSSRSLGVRPSRAAALCHQRGSGRAEPSVLGSERCGRGARQEPWSRGPLRPPTPLEPGSVDAPLTTAFTPVVSTALATRYLPGLFWVVPSVSSDSRMRNSWYEFSSPNTSLPCCHRVNGAACDRAEGPGNFQEVPAACTAVSCWQGWISGRGHLDF